MRIEREESFLTMPFVRTKRKPSDIQTSFKDVIPFVPGDYYFCKIGMKAIKNETQRIPINEEINKSLGQ
jgi:hypothetical protein